MRYAIPIGRLPDGRIVCRVVRSNPVASPAAPAARRAAVSVGQKLVVQGLQKLARLGVPGAARQVESRIRTEHRKGTQADREFLRMLREKKIRPAGGVVEEWKVVPRAFVSKRGTLPADELAQDLYERGMIPQPYVDELIDFVGKTVREVQPPEVDPAQAKREARRLIDANAKFIAGELVRSTAERCEMAGGRVRKNPVATSGSKEARGFIVNLRPEVPDRRLLIEGLGFPSYDYGKKTLEAGAAVVRENPARRVRSPYAVCTAAGVPQHTARFRRCVRKVSLRNPAGDLPSLDAEYGRLARQLDLLQSQGKGASNEYMAALRAMRDIAQARIDAAGIRIAAPRKRNPLTEDEYRRAVEAADLYGKTVAGAWRKLGNARQTAFFGGMGRGIRDTAERFRGSERASSNPLTVKEFESLQRDSHALRGMGRDAGASAGRMWMDLALKLTPEQHQAAAVYGVRSRESARHYGMADGLLDASWEYGPYDPEKPGFTPYKNPRRPRARVRRPNPPAPAELIARKFHGKVMRRIPLRIPRLPRTAYEVGKLEAVVYRPPPWSRIGPNPRVHKFENPQPRLIGFTDKAPWMIVGGSAKFDERGFVG